MRAETKFSTPPKLITDRVSGNDSAETKLQNSLAYRAEGKNASDHESLGTPEQRPRRGLIYDAPLGLKF